MQFMIHQALFGVFESTLQWSCICKKWPFDKIQRAFPLFPFYAIWKKMHSIPIIPKNYFHSTCNNEAFNLYNTHNSQAFKHQDNSSRYFKASWWDSQSEKEKKWTTTWTRYSPASHIRSPAFFKENPSLFCCGICGGGLWAMMGEVAESLLSSIVILDWFWFCCGVGGIFVGNCGSYLVENGLPLGFWSKLLFYIFFFLFF